MPKQIHRDSHTYNDLNEDSTINSYTKIFINMQTYKCIYELFCICESFVNDNLLVVLVFCEYELGKKFVTLIL